jgi:formylglycine-generating enzyme required for sulfatase activity
VGGSAGAHRLSAQEASEKLTVNEVIELLQSGVTPPRVEALARQRGIAFEIIPETENQLRGAGATEDLLKTLHGLAPRPSVLVIETKPGGATIYVDDEPVGKTSSEGRLRLSRLKIGERRLRFTLDGYRDSEHVVTVAEGETVRLVVTLETTKPGPAAPKETLPTASRHEATAPFREPEMVLIPAGEFVMGQENGGKPEKPAHRVYISEFQIAKFVVTNGEYKQFIDATGYRPPAHWQGVKSDYTLWAGAGYPPEIARQPVINVSWDDAMAYCGWLRQATGKPYRLPTEAEWEKAARGGLEQKVYPWGDEAPDHTKAWFGRQWIGTQTLREVDYGAPNGYGLYGMAGNVMQWVADWYEEKYYKKSPARDPQGPTKGLERVMRGGGWQLAAGRCAERHHNDLHMRSAAIGFRVAR